MVIPIPVTKRSPPTPRPLSLPHLSRSSSFRFSLYEFKSEGSPFSLVFIWCTALRLSTGEKNLVNKCSARSLLYSRFENHERDKFRAPTTTLVRWCHFDWYVICIWMNVCIRKSHTNDDVVCDSCTRKWAFLFSSIWSNKSVVGWLIITSARCKIIWLLSLFGARTGIHRKRPSLITTCCLAPDR